MAITTVLVPPSRADTPATFDDDADQFASDLVTWTGEVNTLQTDVNAKQVLADASATAAAVSETNAAASAASASSISSFKGEWSTLTGALAKPSAVLHSGAYWVLLNDLADVTASEPTSANADWAFASGTRWVTPYTATATLAKNSQNTIIATSGAADMSLPTFATNDFVVLHNSPASTQAVRILNTTYTIRGGGGSATSSDNIVVGAGDTVHLVAVSASILEAV